MSSERVIINEDRLASTIDIILAAKQNKTFVFSEGYFSPEEPYINSLISVGEKIGNPDFAADALFLTTSLIRGNRTKLFFSDRIIDEDNIRKYSWIFEPKKVISAGNANTVEAGRQFFKPAGYCITALDNWHYNCRVIDINGGSISRCFDNLDGDWSRIEKFVYLRNRAKSSEKIKAGSLLNYGQHLAYLAFQWLSYYNLYEFTNIDTIPVDFQLARIAIQTDSVVLKGEPNVDEVIARGLTPAFMKICAEKKIDPREVSQVLWSFGSEGCNNKLHSTCPLGDRCVRYITSKKYQRDGKFSDEDEGRHEYVNLSFPFEV
jgi:hypothetical protein